MTESSIREQSDRWFDALEAHELRKLRTAALCVENADIDAIDLFLANVDEQWAECRRLAWQQVVDELTH